MRRSGGTGILPVQMSRHGKSHGQDARAAGVAPTDPLGLANSSWPSMTSALSRHVFSETALGDLRGALRAESLDLAGPSSRRGRTGPERSAPASQRWPRLLRVFSPKKGAWPTKSVTNPTKNVTLGKLRPQTSLFAQKSWQKTYVFCEHRPLTLEQHRRQCTCQLLVSVGLLWRQTPQEREPEVRWRLPFRRRGPLVPGRKAGCRILVYCPVVSGLGRNFVRNKGESLC